MQWQQLMADLGGLLGLFLGFSLCSGIEVMEFGINMIYIASKKNRQTNKITVQTTQLGQGDVRMNIYIIMWSFIVINTLNIFFICI